MRKRMTVVRGKEIRNKLGDKNLSPTRLLWYPLYYRTGC